MQREILFEKLIHRVEQNNKGGFACYWRRMPVLLPIALQAMSINKEVNIPIFFGDKMNVITGEVISSQLISFSYSELALTALMLKLIDPGWFVVDIGTHFGYEALLASKLVGENGNVVCFEPSPATYQLASKNLKKSNIKIHNKAVGDFNGTVKMQNRPITESAFNGISKNNADTHLVDVQLVSLDETFRSRVNPINFIKCDVEGFELEVLKGGIQILREDKPILVLEADMPSTGMNKRADELAEFLLKLDYQGYSFELTGNNLVIDDLNNFASTHANILFVHQSKSSILQPYMQQQ